MFLADCHTHSLCSPDSEIPMVAMGQKAYEYGLTSLTLTDHCDLLSLEGQPTLTYDFTKHHFVYNAIRACDDAGNNGGNSKAKQIF